MKKSNLSLLVLIAIMFSFAMPSMAQDDKYGDNKDECLMNLSLYQEFYKQWQSSGYKSNAAADAIGPLRKCLKNCPRSSQAMYQKAERIYLYYYMSKAETDELRLAYLDSVLYVIERRAEMFPIYKGESQVGKLFARRGITLYANNPAAYKEAYELLKESVRLDGDKIANDVAAIYFSLTCTMANNGEIDPSVVVETFDQINGYTDINLERYANNPEDLAKWQTTAESIEAEFQPFASCEALEGIFQVKYDENPDDLDLLKKIAETLDKAKCDESPLFFTVTKKLYEIEPSAESAYLMSSILLKEANYSEAIKYLSDAIDLIEDQDKKANAELKLASAYYNTQKYESARNHANACLAITPNEGNAYMIIGNCYAASASNCGANDFEQKAVYWLAVDQYLAAKRVDPSVASQADRSIASYSKYFPTAETIFFNDYAEGASYKVGCWINRSTTVRAAK